MRPTRVMVVDDSPLIRQIIVDMLRKEDDIEVVGYARDGEEALGRIAELTPDVVTLDVDMPRMDGLTCLRELVGAKPTPAVMISMPSPLGIETTLEALALGAADFVCKPESGSITTLRGIREELLEKVRRARFARIPAPALPSLREATAVRTDRILLLAGASGSVRSLEAVFDGLPEGFSAPVLISVPIPHFFLAPLARRLSELGAMPVVEARPGDRAEPGTAYLATGMTLNPAGFIEIENGSTDDFLSSAADLYGEQCIAAILSGQTNDGADGAMAIRRAGGTVFAESEETCTHYALPEAALAHGAVESSFPAHTLGNALAIAATPYWQSKTAA